MDATGFLNECRNCAFWLCEMRLLDYSICEYCEDDVMTLDWSEMLCLHKCTCAIFRSTGSLFVWEIRTLNVNYLCIKDFETICIMSVACINNGLTDHNFLLRHVAVFLWQSQYIYVPQSPDVQLYDFDWIFINLEIHLNLSIMELVCNRILHVIEFKELTLSIYKRQ